MSKISVVVPCYNAERYLAEALASIRAQTHPIEEIIVVDDGSTDRSVVIAKAFGARCLSTGVNAGPSAARNLGIQAARNELIAFIDGDDYWDPEHCAVLSGLLARFGDVAVAFSRFRYVGSFAGEPPRRAPEEAPFCAFWELVARNMVPQSGVLARRAALLEVGGYNPRMRYSEDYELWLRISQNRPFIGGSRMTANHRCHEGQASRHALSLLQGAWDTRFRLLEEARRARPQEIQDRIGEKLVEAWSTDLEDRWSQRDRVCFGYLLALAPLIPGSRPLGARWGRRAWVWPLWQLAGIVWHRLPARVRSRARRLPLARWRSPG